MSPIPPVTDRDHTLGPADARHTLVLYGDFACPFSRQVFLLAQNVLKIYPADVRYVFRHFPLRAHEHALEAAEVAEAAAAQGAFWPMYERLFNNQFALSTNELLMHADALGLDAREVKTALNEGVYREHVLAEKRAAVAAGLDSTLNLVIDGTVFQEDDVDDALLERVIRPLRARESGGEA